MQGFYLLANARAVALAAAALVLPAVAGAHGGHGQTISATSEAPVVAASATSVAATTAAVKATPPVDLRVTYFTRVVGQDGVERSATHTNRVYRRVGSVWTERELPKALRDSQSHGHDEHKGPHAGHAHDEANGAPLRVSRADDGVQTVEVVLHKTRRVIEVDRAHHGNVGYGGSWDTQYWLVPPAALSAMRPEGAPKNGVQRYRQQQGEQTTVVDWDIQGQFPRMIERNDGHGLSTTRVKAERIAAPQPAPWAASAQFDRGDYSDLLD